ncbi:MAG: hypothetical protein V4671_11300 [Armatimonadota bacterium]
MENEDTVNTQPDVPVVLNEIAQHVNTISQDLDASQGLANRKTQDLAEPIPVPKKFPLLERMKNVNPDLSRIYRQKGGQ